MYKKKDDGATKSPRFEPKEAWKYIELKDLSKPIEIDDKKWYFCTKCKCQATGRIGFYQLLHTDATHDPNWTPEGNLTPVQDPDPTPALPLRSPITFPALDNDLIFTGVNHAPVILPSTVVDKREGEDVCSTEGAALDDCWRQIICQRTLAYVVVDTTGQIVS